MSGPHATPFQVAIQGFHDKIATLDGQRAAGKKILLNVDDNERITGLARLENASHYADPTRI